MALKTTAEVARGGNNAAVAAMEVEAAAIGESLELRENVWRSLLCFSGDVLSSLPFQRLLLSRGFFATSRSKDGDFRGDTWINGGT